MVNSIINVHTPIGSLVQISVLPLVLFVHYGVNILHGRARIVVFIIIGYQGRRAVVHCQHSFFLLIVMPDKIVVFLFVLLTALRNIYA